MGKDRSVFNSVLNGVAFAIIALIIFLFLVFWCFVNMAAKTLYQTFSLILILGGLTGIGIKAKFK